MTVCRHFLLRLYNDYEINQGEQAMENNNIIEKDVKKWECPQCGGKCGEIANTCMFGAFSKDEFYYCDKCRITYVCDENGKKIRVN